MSDPSGARTGIALLAPRLLHTMLRVGHLEDSLAFYVGRLGMRLLRRQDFVDGQFTLAFVGSTVSEMNASNQGIGYLLVSAGSSMKMPLAFAGLVVIGAMAMAMYELFAIIERRTTAWAHRGK